MAAFEDVTKLKRRWTNNCQTVEGKALHFSERLYSGLLFNIFSSILLFIYHVKNRRTHTAGISSGWEDFKWYFLGKRDEVKWLVMNLRCLNQFISYQPFKMDGLFCKLDIKDAYFSFLPQHSPKVLCLGQGIFTSSSVYTSAL